MNYSKSDKLFTYMYTAESPYLTFPSSELQKAKNNPLILDNITNWYVFEDEVKMGFSIIRKYENILRANLIEIDLDEEFYYRPEMLSYHIYGTTDLWYLILFVNNLSTPMKFNMKKCLIPSESVIDALIKLASNETDMKESYDNPKMIYKHILKDLNSPSKQVLPSDFDSSLYDKTKLKDYKNITNDYLNKENFEEYNNHLLEGILKNTYSLVLNNNEYYDYNNPRHEYSGFYNKLDNYYSEEMTMFSKYDLTDYLQIHKEGFLRVYNTGKYHFKVYTNGNFNMYINGNGIANFIGKDSAITSEYTKNLFEEYSMNSDFKRRNLDYWDYTNTNISSLIFDSTLNKNLLSLGVPIQANTSTKIYEVNIPVESITFENEGDFIYYIDYYLPTGKRYHKLYMVLDIITKDGTHYTEIQESLSDYIKREPYFKNTETLIYTRPKSLKNENISSIKLELYLNGSRNIENFNNLEETSTTINISKIKVFSFQDPIEMSDYEVYLNKDVLYTFETILQKEINSPDIFKVLYSYESSDNWKNIPRGWFSIEAPNEDFKFSHNLLSIYKEKDSEKGDYEIKRQLVYDEISIHTNLLEEFNLPVGFKYRFNLRFYPEYISQFNNILRVISPKDTRVDIYKHDKNYQNSFLCGSKTESSLYVDINLNDSNNSLNENQNCMMIDYFSHSVDVTDFDITLYANGNENNRTDYNDLLYNFDFIKEYPYELSNGEFLLKPFSPLKNSIYKVINKKNIKDDWILDMKFLNYTINEALFMNHNYKVMSLMKGIFGFIFEFLDDDSYYMLVFNYNNNELPFIKNGLYRFNRSIPIKKYNENQIHKFFLDNFELLSEVILNDFSNQDSLTEKNFKIMKRDNYIIFNENNNKKPYLVYKFDKDIEVYKEGKLGFFSHELDGIKIDMTLWN